MCLLHQVRGPGGIPAPPDTPASFTTRICSQRESLAVLSVVRTIQVQLSGTDHSFARRTEPSWLKYGTSGARESQTRLTVHRMSPRGHSRKAETSACGSTRFKIAYVPLPEPEAECAGRWVLLNALSSPRTSQSFPILSVRLLYTCWVSELISVSIRQQVTW